MNKKILKGHLEELSKILKEEKSALIKNDGNNVQEIVDKKTILVEKIEKYRGQITKEDEEIVSIKEEIDSLQELNLLLTKQALSYQKSLLESIAVNVKKVSNTYSNRGEYGRSESINLVNQKV
jgi:flagellar biosynthesis/type III secretory pathway chaperone